VQALCNPYPVDGRVTWHAPEARGHATMNTYLVREGDDALIIDTGVALHTAALLEQLATLLAPDTRLAVMHTRIGEYTTISNTVPVAERFGCSRIHSEQDDSPLWVDFLAGHGRDRPGPDPFADTAIERYVAPAAISVDAGGHRVLDVFHATLRLLPTSWLFDHRSHTLFTSDVFSHVLRADARGPWIVTDPDDADATAALMRRHLLSTRYWWLAGARLDEIRESLASTFARYEVETIAPGFGCILTGAEVVRRAVGALDRILAEAAAMAPVPMASALANP
jgi:flavorubredoxin